MADSTLDAIRIKIRRLTRTPSTNQLSDAVIDHYINTFVLYDFPNQIQTFDLKTTFNFWTIPYVDSYPTIGVAINTPLYEFRNKYINVKPPIYIDGREAFYSESREEFYAAYPLSQSIERISTGNGVTTVYTGTLSKFPLTQNNVSFRSLSATYGSLVKHDVPVVDADGYNTPIGNLYIPGAEPATPPTIVDAVNTINYRTGVYTITFPSAPLNGAEINASTLPYNASRPNSLLYFNDIFTVRPIPDKVYQVNMEVSVVPTELLSISQNPDIKQWWQYIAYGGAKKIFEDRMDQESVQAILAEMTQQEILCMRKTILLQSDQSVPTIYSSQINRSFGPGFNWFNGN